MEKEAPAKSEMPRSVSFKTVKSTAFKLVYGSGFTLQPDPRGGARLTVFNDRVPFGESHEHAVNSAGKIEGQAGGEGDFINVFEREIEMEIAVPDSHMLALWQNMGLYLQWRGIIAAVPKDTTSST